MASTRRGAGTADCFAENDDSVLAQRFETLPSRPAAKFRDLVLDLAGIVARKNQILGLEVQHFFQVNVRPILRRRDHGAGTRQAESIGKERVASDRNQRVHPGDEKYGSRLAAGKPFAELLQTIAQTHDELGTLDRWRPACWPAAQSRRVPARPCVDRQRTQLLPSRSSAWTVTRRLIVGVANTRSG